MNYRITKPTKEQKALADQLAAAALSVGGAGRVAQESIPQPKTGPKFTEHDYKVVAELATDKVIGIGSCIMYLALDGAFYFQPIAATFPVAPIRKFA